MDDIMDVIRCMKLISATIVSLGMAGAAYGQSCPANGGFEAFKTGIAKEAAVEGVGANVVRRIVPGLSFSDSVIAADRKQGVFSQSFLEFSDRMVAPYRVNGGRERLQRHGDIFRRIEAEYGVPGAVISAFWALETDFGAVLGNFNTLNALATLAYDCRRPELFRPQLIAALKLLDRGDLTASQMQGAWAGELGQLQILPSDYLENGVDYDGDGRVDLLKNTGDVLATGGKLLNVLGWRRGEPWLQEVRVPGSLRWEQAGIYTTLPASDWAAMGVAARNGLALEGNTLPASLILPMGRNGPAFLAYPNFGVFLEWNQSLVYTVSAAYLATRINGAPKLERGNPGEILSVDQTKALQALLRARGYDVGEIDGIIGSGTRAGVRAVQMELGLPADAWPTRDLLAQLQGNQSSAAAPSATPPLPNARP